MRPCPESRFAFQQTLPVLVGYLFLGVAFGLMLQHAGYHAGWAFLASLVIYAGSMQFVLVSILATGMSLPTVLLMTLSINSRHFFYGLPFLQTFRKMGRRLWYMVFSLTDETYALLYGVRIPEGLCRNKVYFRIALFNHIYWVAGSTLGALVGELIRFNLTGIDFAMTALFTVILVEQWLSGARAARLSVLLGLFTAVVARLVLGPDRFVLPSLVVMSVVLILLRPHLLPASEEEAAS